MTREEKKCIIKGTYLNFKCDEGKEYRNADFREPTVAASRYGRIYGLIPEQSR